MREPEEQTTDADLDAAQREIDAEFDRLSREESQRAVDQAEQPGAWPTPEETQDFEGRR